MVNAGANVGVAYDIDGQTRVAVPDIGADEPGGTTPPANDIAAAVIINPASSSTQPTGASTSPQASFTNTGSATQTNVGVKFTISGPGGYSYLGTQTIATISPFQTVVVTFPVAPTFNLAGAYTTNAQVTTADSNATNDAISGTFQVISPVSGTVNVGNGGDFTSLSNPGGLFDLINTVGVSGNVTALITSDLTSETGAIPLNSMAAGSSLTIKPSGAARTVSGSGVSLSMIKLNGADNVIIDGSLSGSTDRSLTLMYTNTAGAVIWIGSASTGNGANGDMVKNCMIASNPGTLSIAGIVAGSGTTLGGNAEAPNNNNWIINNQIFRVQNSAFIAGAAAFDQGWLVADNNFGSNVQADKNVFRGMLIGNTQNMSVIHNTISGISSTTTTAAAMSGIQLAFSLNGGIVVENRISDIKNNSASGTGAFGMQISATSAASNVLIANNFISDVAALGSATVVNNGHGINVNGAGVGGLRIYHNSVNMNTNQASGTTSALNVTSAVTAAGAIDLRNNILTNSQTSGATRFAVFNASSASVISPINGNDYFAQNVGSIAGVTKATLADWLATTGQDSNSVAVDPLFISSTDLHLQTGSPMRNAGVTGLGITTDIDGQTRDANPDIGADELPPLVLSGTLQLSSATYSISEGGGMVTITVTRTGGSSGAVGVNFATSNGTATGGGTCGGSVDYVNTSGSLMWADGDMASKTFTIPVCNDVIPEPDETVNIALSGATGGATVGTPATSVLTITNDDIPGTLSVNDVRVWEGNGGNVNATFTVSYIGNAIPVSVQYSTSNGTATAGVDYISSSGTLNFNAPAPSPNSADQSVRRKR